MAGTTMVPERILRVIILAVFMPVTFLAVFFAAPAAMVHTVPMAEAKQVEYYLQAASEVNEKYGLEVKWQEILALDTVLLGQNFSQSSVERAKRLAAEFVQKEVVETEEVEAKVNVLYKQVPLDKVMVACRLSSEQKDQVSLFLKMIGSRGLVSDVIPDGWVPSGRGQFIWPLPKGQYTITSLFGPRVLNGVAGFHRGLDMGAPQGTPIFAAADGTVINCGWLGQAGRAIIVRHAGEFETSYYHLSRINVRAGQTVKQGTVIGLVGSTGNSTGNHLHFEIRRRKTALDPLSFY